MPKPDRQLILEAAITHTCGDRNVQYGSPFINLDDIAGLWTAYLVGKYRGKTVDEEQFRLTAEDVAHFNVLQKMARTFSGRVKQDTYEDQAAYSAIAGECAMTQKDLEFAGDLDDEHDFTSEQIAALMNHPESRS